MDPAAMMAQGATYVYCVVRAARRPSLSRGVPTLPDATVPVAVPVLPHLFLVVTTVPLDVYGPGALEPRLRDLDWVAAVAMAHERLVEQLARGRSQTVVPTKLFTMFSSVESAANDIRGRRGAIAAIVRRIAGCDEWGIRVTREPASPKSESPGRIDSGTAYLAARKAARDAVRIVRTEAASAADGAFDRLQRLSRDARRGESPREGVNPPILEAAFLVTRNRRARFTAEARTQAALCADAGARLVLTGPWPAYSFVESSGMRR